MIDTVIELLSGLYIPIVLVWYINKSRINRHFKKIGDISMIYLSILIVVYIFLIKKW